MLKVSLVRYIIMANGLIPIHILLQEVRHNMRMIMYLSVGIFKRAELEICNFFLNIAILMVLISYTLGPVLYKKCSTKCSCKVMWSKFCRKKAEDTAKVTPASSD